MQNLFVYGDSYSSSQLDQVGPGWACLLSQSLNFNLNNRAVSGCSTHYQFFKLIEDWQTNQFQDGDLIIFGTGYPERYHFLHQRIDPESANIHSENKWVRKNKKYLDWYQGNLDYDYCHYNQGMIPHVLRSIAEARPNLTIIMPQVLRPFFTFPITCPKNFFILDFQLHDISVREFDNFDFPDWHKYTGIDLRMNHLCIDNLKIFSNMLENIYRTKRVEENLESKFLKKVFFKSLKNEKDIKQVVDQGLLYEPTHINMPCFFKIF